MFDFGISFLVVVSRDLMVLVIVDGDVWLIYEEWYG